MWGRSARLNAKTRPQIHRESLVPLVLAAHSCGHEVTTLPLLDPPPEHAVEAALEELRVLKALGDKGQLTDRGRALFHLPIAPHLGRWLQESERMGILEDAVDVVAVLTTHRPLFAPGDRPSDPEDDLRKGGSDLVAFVHAVRLGDPRRHGLHANTLQEARANAKRLRKAWQLGPRSDKEAKIDLSALTAAAIAADHRVAHVARRRRGKTTWSHGSTEIDISRESALLADKAEAAIVLGTRALGIDVRRTQLVGTCASPVTLRALARAGLGEERIRGNVIKGQRVLSTIERVYAGTVIATREDTPKGALAREAIVELFLQGRFMPTTLPEFKDRHMAHALAARLGKRDPTMYVADLVTASQAEWLATQLDISGVDSGDDLPLLTENDLLPPALPPQVKARLDAAYPRQLKLAGVLYELRYDLDAKTVTLVGGSGPKGRTPPLNLLPAFHGLRVFLQDRGTSRLLRDRR